ncbi:MAG: DUF167 domain-containing protein [Patescibacteria group bacterium]
MYIQIKVVPKSRETAFIEKMDDETYKIRIRSAPEKGRANEELIKFLSDSLKIPKDSIKIISGHTDPRKLLKIPDNTIIPW